MRTVQQLCEDAFRHHRDGDLRNAEFIYDQILQKIDHADPSVLFGYGSLLIHQGRYGLGITMLKGALAQCDTFAPIWNNLAVAYRYAGEREKSLTALKRALALDSRQPETLASLAGHYLNDDASVKAEEYARRSLAELETASGHMHLGLALLEQGRYDEAWPHYEYRWETLDRIKDKRPYTAPQWQGQPVKTLAIHGEQGLGDEILFMSLFRKAALRADRIIIECAPRLIPWFSRSFGVPCYGTHNELIAAEGEPDAYVAMGSLPLLLGLPKGGAYLHRETLKPHFKPIIGMAWKGGTQRTNKDERSLWLADMQPILQSSDAEFVSLQYGDDSVDIEAASYGIQTGPRDLDSLIARTAQCDLVVSVCQTAVHIAGAMGVPCFVLTPRKAAWRYCGARMWYDSVSIFRQAVTGEWQETIERVALAVTRETLHHAA